MDEPSMGWSDFIGAWDLFRDPVMCAVIAGGALGLVGVYIVLRRVVFFAAVQSQAAGLGVALAIWAGMLLDIEIEPMIGAVVMCLLGTLLLTVRPEKWHLSREVLLGTAWVTAGAGAVVVGEKISVEAHDISSILFGSAVLVRPLDVQLVGSASALVFVAHIFLRRGFVFTSFDGDVARVAGLPSRSLDLFLWVLVALLVALSTRALGALPVFAFSVLPALAALMLVQRLGFVFPLAAALGAAAGGLGYVFAFFESLPVGGAQALVAFSFVAIAALVRAIRGG